MRFTFFIAIPFLLSISFANAQESKITVRKTNAEPGTYTAKCTTTLPSKESFEDHKKVDCYILSYRVYDVLGKPVANESHLRETILHINLMDQSNGIYIVQFDFFSEDQQNLIQKVTRRLTHNKTR